VKTLILAAAVFGVAAGAAHASDQVCLTSYKIDHTKVVNPSTVLFYMKDGKIWQNDLPVPCPGLEFHGFVMVGHQDEFCGMQGISIIQTNQACSLGRFTPYVAPQAGGTP
jgi:hypothetical protein